MDIDRPRAELGDEIYCFLKLTGELVVMKALWTFSD